MMGGDDNGTLAQFERQQRMVRLLFQINELKSAYKERDDYFDIKGISEIALKLETKGGWSRNRAERAFDNVELGGLVDVELPSNPWWERSDKAKKLEPLIKKIESESEVKFGFKDDVFSVWGLRSASIDYLPDWDEVLIEKIKGYSKSGEAIFKEGPFYSPDFESKKEMNSPSRLPKTIFEFWETGGFTDIHLLFTRPKRVESLDVKLVIYEPTFKAIGHRRKSGADFIEGSTRMRIYSPSQYQMLNTLSMLIDYKTHKSS